MDIRLTELMNICYVSDRVACTIKIDVKETFMGNDSFLKCLCGGLQSENKRPIA